jgi:hypothetical protein
MAYGLQLPARRPRPALPPPARPARLAPRRPPRLVRVGRGRPARLAPFYLAHRDDRHGHPPTTPRTCSACSSMATASACAPPGGSNDACTRTSPSASLPRARPGSCVTIAWFRARHEQALAGFLVASLELCAATAMVKIGVVALDAPTSRATPLTRPAAPTTSSKPRSARSCARRRGRRTELRNRVEELMRALGALAAYDPRLNNDVVVVARRDVAAARRSSSGRSERPR